MNFAKPTSLIALLFAGLFLNSCAERTPDHIKIVYGETTLSDTTIESRIILQDLKDKLVFNNDAVKDNAKEYEWSVNFDTDNDGFYELSMALMTYKIEGEEENYILNSTQSNVWKINKKGSTVGGSVVGSLDTKISGDTIIFTAVRNEALSGLSSNSSIKYQSYYDNGVEVFEDSLINSPPVANR